MRAPEAAASESCVRVHDEGSVRVITLARAHRHNSLVPEFLTEIRAAVSTVRDEPSIRVVVIVAEGENFSTGGDVAQFAAHSGSSLTAYARELVGELNAAILDLVNLDVPVISAVQGIVTGGSIGLVLASDIVLVEPHTTFRPYYVDVGFSPDGGWSALLPQCIGWQRAMAVQLFNSTIDAQQALDWGLAAEVVTGDLMETALERARLIAVKQPASVRRTKRLMRADVKAIEAGLDLELENFVSEIASDAAAAGMQAFLTRPKKGPAIAASSTDASGSTHASS